jgi:D-isomer specific 2-hydroxyacid dehydrogenase, NAD binding domain
MHAKRNRSRSSASNLLRRLKPFDVKLHYTDRHRLPESVEQDLKLTYHSNVESMVQVCDVITINCPLHPETEHLFNDALIGKMKRGVHCQYGARQDLRPRCNFPGARERTAGRLRRRHLVPTAGAAGSPLADDAAPWHDAAYLGDESIGTGALCCRSARNSGVLVQRSSHSR